MTKLSDKLLNEDEQMKAALNVYDTEEEKEAVRNYIKYFTDRLEEGLLKPLEKLVKDEKVRRELEKHMK